jgi:hypothetical protein
MIRMRRPVTQAEADDFSRRMTAAFEAEGIERGDEFVIVDVRKLTNPKARKTDPDTARLAALKNRPRAGSQRARILEVIEGAAGMLGMTADEVHEALPEIPLNSLSTRISELKEGGHVEPIPGVTRKTRQGAEAEALRAIER